MPLPTPKAWERQPGESSPAWDARKIYIHMGPGRSLERVSQESTKSVPLLKRWSIRWKWVLSAKLFDAYNDEIVTKAVVKKKVADAVVRTELWGRRADEQPNGDYLAWMFYFNMLAEVQLGKLKPTVALLGMIGRNIARLSPIARAAREEMAKRMEGDTLTEPSNGTESSDYVRGRGLAVLKAFVDYQEPENEAGNEPA